MLDLEWMKNNPTHVSDIEVLKLINALEEGKEIENFWKGLVRSNGQIMTQKQLFGILYV